MLKHYCHQYRSKSLADSVAQPSKALRNNQKLLKLTATTGTRLLRFDTTKIELNAFIRVWTIYVVLQ